MLKPCHTHADPVPGAYTMPDPIDDFLQLFSQEKSATQQDSSDSSEPQVIEAAPQESETSKVERLCKVCNLPLEFELGHQWHDDCAKCQYCGNECGYEIMQKRFKENSGIFHDYCASQETEKKFKSLPVTLTQGDLDQLNIWNLMFTPDLNLSVETNQKNAEIAASKQYWSCDMTFEQRQMVLKRIEAVAAAWSVALSKDENKVRVDAKYSGLIKATENKRSLERIEVEKQRIAKRERDAKKLSPAARAEDKAIKAMMTLGMSYEEAIEKIEEQKNRGKK